VRQFPERLIAVVKRDCPTCNLIVPVLRTLAAKGPLTIYSQDDSGFPEGVPGVVSDVDLEQSYRLGIHVVPTLIGVTDGAERGRALGWHRGEWEQLSGVTPLGPELPETRPGCASRTEEPGVRAGLAIRYGSVSFQSRPVRIPATADPIEACYDRGWTDGLPVVPPTRERVLAMLTGTTRSAAAVVGRIPPDYAECTVEKAAINAVMAGCKPEYLPVVLTAVEAALAPEFGLHGVLATTNAIGPVVMVNGPVARAIGMNARGNAFGQGNRANATIGRALQLIVRNVGGGRPGEIDRAVLGNPGKYTFCFAEDEREERRQGVPGDQGSGWESFAVERGFAPGASTVTVFPGDGTTPIVDEISRTADSLVQSFASVLRAAYNPKKIGDLIVVVVVTPEHARVFQGAGWSKRQFKTELEGLLESKFRRLDIVRAGGSAGKFSAYITGLASITSGPVTREVLS
jgi:hypothetical protein